MLVFLRWFLFIVLTPSGCNINGRCLLLSVVVVAVVVVVVVAVLVFAVS